MALNISVCSSGRWGNECSMRCDSKCPNNECHHITGNCGKTCPPGTTGSECSIGMSIC